MHTFNRMGQITFHKFEIERRLLKLLLLKESPQKPNPEPQPKKLQTKKHHPKTQGLHKYETNHCDVAKETSQFSHIKAKLLNELQTSHAFSLPLLLML